MQWAGRLRAIRSSIDKESKSVKAKVEAKVGAVEAKIEAKVGAVEEKLDAIMELLLRAAPAVPAPPPASSSSALQAAEPTVAGASEAPDEAPRNTKKSVMRKMSSKFS